MIGNIAQNGIRKTYRNQPMPGVSTPTTVNRPMIPKMNAPIRMRSLIDRSGPSSPRARACALLGAAVGVSPAAARFALAGGRGSRSTPSSTPRSKSPALKCGAITLRMMRLACEIGEPAFEAVADFDAHLALGRDDDERAPVVLALLPSFHDSNTATAYSSMLSPPSERTVSTATWSVVASSCAFRSAVTRLGGVRRTASPRCRRRGRSERECRGSRRTRRTRGSASSDGKGAQPRRSCAFLRRARCRRARSLRAPSNVAVCVQQGLQRSRNRPRMPRRVAAATGAARMAAAIAIELRRRRVSRETGSGRTTMTRSKRLTSTQHRAPRRGTENLALEEHRRSRTAAPPLRRARDRAKAARPAEEAAAAQTAPAPSIAIASKRERGDAAPVGQRTAERAPTASAPSAEPIA